MLEKYLSHNYWFEIKFNLFDRFYQLCVTVIHNCLLFIYLNIDLKLPVKDVVLISTFQSKQFLTHFNLTVG